MVLAPDPSPSLIRALVYSDVAGVIDSPTGRTMAQAQSVVAAATGNLVIPLPHAPTLLERLDEPPRPLSDEERALLSLAATRSIEAAGKALGLSRRQTQRRFKTLCDDLGLASHLHAAVAAGRWGLAHHNGAKSPRHGLESPPDMV